MIKTVLVTGGAGYIGSVLVRKLLEEGFQVKVVDNFYFGEDKLPQDEAKLTAIKADIRFCPISVFENVDAVIDLAAISNDPAGELNKMSTYSINHLGRVRVAMLAKKAGVKRYILPASCSCYGFQDEEVDETAAVNPLTTYAEANYLAELDVLELADDDFCVVRIRQSTVYGYSPRMRFDLAINGMVKGFLKNGKIPILKDGNQWRPFVHVRDTSNAMIKILNADQKLVQKEVFNVGANEQNYQIFDLAKRVATAMDMPFEYEWYGQPDHRSYRVNFDKIKNVLGFEPEYNAEKGAKEVFDAIKAEIVNPDDPQTITLAWYKKIMAEGVQV